MLRTEFRQSDLDFDPSMALARHFSIEADAAYWDEVEKDLTENPDIWALPDYEELAQ